MRLYRRTTKQPEILAAVDLGSNSFHMIVARLSHGQPKVIDRLREMVRLAAGLDEDNLLNAERQKIALDCLARFGERIRDMHADSVRVVGTNTLRKIQHNSGFVEKAATCLGHPVEIISGLEEARLIYQGVVHSSPGIDGGQLVVDIGGGSTEIIHGTGREADAMESIHLGCVALSHTYFGGGKLSRRRFERARFAARLQLEPSNSRFRRFESERVIGASGTIRAAQSVLSAIAGEPTDITVSGLQMLIDRAIDAGQLKELDLPDLSQERKPVFPGGLAILIEVLAALDADRMSVSDGALREGLLYDMVGRVTDEDARVRTVRSMEGRFNIDAVQADYIESAALFFLEQVAESWKLDSDIDGQMLSWAARLHEIGLHISHSRYQQLGAYLLEYADMPGFPTGEQQVLACLVRGHRGKLGGQVFADIPDAWSRRAMRLMVLLRLAVLFNRNRTGDSFDDVRCTAKGRRISVGVPRARLESSPLTADALEREQRLLADIGIEMVVE